MSGRKKWLRSWPGAFQSGSRLASVCGSFVHFFVDDDPRSDRAAQQTLEDCARSIGFTHVEFELEPIAAALDFETTLHAEQITLIADVGGGTADFSVVRLGPTRASRSSRKEDILAALGVHIGGTDFDHLLAMA